MKQYLPFFFIIICLVSSCLKTGKKEKNDLKKEDFFGNEMNLLGKVKFVSEYRYTAEDKFGDTNKTTLESVDSTTYNENGRFIEQYGYKYDGGKVYTWKGSVTYKYDNNDNLIEESHYCVDTLNYKIIYKYDEKNNLIEECNYNSAGKLDNNEDVESSKPARYVYLYNDKNNLIEQNEYWVNGSLSTKDKMQYDDNGNKIEENSYSSDGNLWGKTTYKYDEKNNLIENSLFDRDGKLNTKEKYDKRGNKIEYNDNVFKYDDKNNLIEAKYDGIGVYLYRHRNFDKVGNWLKEIISIPMYGGITGYEIIERKIEYY